MNRLVLSACTLAAALVFVLADQAFAAAFPGQNGRIAFVSDRDGNDEIYSVLPDGGDPLRLTAVGGVDGQPAWSPDGTRIAYSRGVATPGEIWVMNADGSGKTALTGPGGGSEPAWSPDGTKIAFADIRNEPDGSTTGRELWVMDADGSDVRRLTSHPSADHAPTWSPSGDRIAFHSNRDGGFEIYSIDASSVPGAGTDSAIQLTADVGTGAANPTWSPDGTRIAFERGAGTNVGDTTKELWVMDADGSDEVELTDNADYDVHPSWSPDGTRIAFESDAGADGDREIVSMAPTVGAPAVEVTSTTSGIDDSQPDWGAVAIVTPDPEPDDPGDGGTGGGTGGSGTGGGTGGTDGTGGTGGSTGTTTAYGGPKASCREPVTFGVVQLLGCFTRQGEEYVTAGTVTVNGIALVPVGSARLTVLPGRRRIHSDGGEFRLHAGTFELYRGPIDWTLGGAAIQLRPIDGAKLGDLPVAGPLQISFLSGLRAKIGAIGRMPFFEALQRACSAMCPRVTADVVAITDNATGLQRQGLTVSARNVTLGLTTVETFEGQFDPGTLTWQASGTLRVVLPQPLRITADWVIERGILKSATASVRGKRTPISIGVVVERLDLALRSSPFELFGTTLVSAGPTIGGRAAFSTEGNFLLRRSPLALPGQGGTLRVEGTARIVDVPVVTGHAQLWPSGAMDVGARVALGLPNMRASDPRRQPAFVAASLSGWLDRRAFNAEAAAEVIVLGQLAARGELVVSSVGFAACGQLGWLRGGVARRWSTAGVSILAGACDIGPYRARAAQADPGTLRLDDAPQGVMLRFRGRGAAPLVVLEGPGGQRIVAPADGSPVADGRFVVLQDPDGQATHVAIRRPAGTWRVSVAAGSVPLAGVDSAEVLAPPAVSARVTRRGSRRLLTWRLASRPGQRVTFVERGADSVRTLARTSAARGRVAFSPAPGQSRARRIMAIVEQSGVPRDTLTVARYTAPPWRRPGRPRAVRVRRRGSSLVVSWRRVAGAERYAVLVRHATGERDLHVLPRSQTRLRVPGVGPRERAVLEVSALRVDGVAGRRATVAVRPASRRRPSR